VIVGYAAEAAFRSGSGGRVTNDADLDVRLFDTVRVDAVSSDLVRGAFDRVVVESVLDLAGFGPLRVPVPVGQRR